MADNKTRSAGVQSETVTFAAGTNTNEVAYVTTGTQNYINLQGYIAAE